MDEWISEHRKECDWVLTPWAATAVVLDLFVAIRVDGTVAEWTVIPGSEGTGAKQLFRLTCNWLRKRYFIRRCTYFNRHEVLGESMGVVSITGQFIINWARWLIMTAVTKKYIQRTATIDNNVNSLISEVKILHTVINYSEVEVGGRIFIPRRQLRYNCHLCHISRNRRLIRRESPLTPFFFFYLIVIRRLHSSKLRGVGGHWAAN